MPKSGNGSDLWGDRDMPGLLVTQTQQVSADAELDGIAEGASTDDFDPGSAAKPHFEQAPALLGVTADLDDMAASTDAQTVELADVGAGRIVAFAGGLGSVVIHRDRVLRP